MTASGFGAVGFVTDCVEPADSAGAMDDDHGFSFSFPACRRARCQRARGPSWVTIPAAPPGPLRQERVFRFNAVSRGVSGGDRRRALKKNDMQAKKTSRRGLTAFSTSLRAQCRRFAALFDVEVAFFDGAPLAARCGRWRPARALRCDEAARAP